MTTQQVARWLALVIPEVAEMDVAARAERGERSRSAVLPSYRSAYRALRGLRGTGEVEVIDLHRTWSGAVKEGSNAGRAESYHRITKTREGATVTEAGLLAGVEDGQRSAYARHWLGGAIPHSAHRTDVILTLLESCDDPARNPFGATMDEDSCWGESAPNYPLIGAQYEATDAAGKQKYDRKKQKKSKYPHRLFERVVPDAELVLTIPLSGVVPSADDDRRDHLPTDDDEGWQDVDATGSGGEVYA